MIVGMVLAASVGVALLAGCSRKRPGKGDPVSSAGTVEVSLLLNWLPEAEHGGYFAAEVHGFFEDEGLKVQIISGGPGAAVVPRLATGSVEFGVENGDHVLLSRAQEAPVVAVMAPIQIHPRCILVHQESGITKLSQLRDLTLAMNAGGAFSHYLKRHVPLEGVKIVPYSGNVSQFVRDKNCAQQGYVFSEPYVAKQQGAKPRLLLLSEIGFNPYTSCLLTTEKMIQENPAIVAKMVRASVRGWEQYLADPVPTNERIHKLNPEMALGALAYGANALTDFVLDKHAREHRLGQMTEERWRTLRDQLVETELIPAGRVDPKDAFTSEFLREPKQRS